MKDAFGEELKRADRVAYVHSTPSGKVTKEMVHVKGFTKQCVKILPMRHPLYVKYVQPHNLIVLEHDSDSYSECECDECKSYYDCEGCEWEFLRYPKCFGDNV